MELRHVQTFQTIAHEGSFVRAAERLGYAQSTITLHVQQLEAELKVKLFARQGKRIQLTEAGRTLSEHAEQLLQRATLLQQAIADLTAGEAGHLRIGAIEPFASYRLPDLIVQFCAARPQLRLTLEVGGTQRISHLIAERELDLGICSPPAAQMALRFEPLFTERVVLVLPEHHPLAALPSIPVAELGGQRVLVTHRTCAYRREAEQGLLECGMLLDASIEIGSQEALKRAVQEGLGVGLLPESAVCPPPTGTVVRLLAEIPLELPIGFVRRAEEESSGRGLADFAALVRASLAEQPVSALVS